MNENSTTDKAIDGISVLALFYAFYLNRKVGTPMTFKERERYRTPATLIVLAVAIALGWKLLKNF